MVIAFLVFLTLNAQAFDWDKTTCPAETGGTFDTDQLNRLSFEGIKKLQLGAARADMRNFCRRNLTVRLLNSKSFPIDQRASKTNKELENIIDKNIFGGSGTEWDLSLASTELTRSKALEES